MLYKLYMIIKYRLEYHFDEQQMKWQLKDIIKFSIVDSIFQMSLTITQL